MVKKTPKWSRFGCAAVVASLLLVAAPSAEATVLSETGSVQWRTVATEPDPACSFSASSEGSATWDSDNERFTVAAGSEADLTVEYTNVASISITRGTHFEDTDALTADSPHLPVNNTEGNENVTISEGASADLSLTTPTSGTNDVGQIDTTSQIGQDTIKVSIGGSVGITTGHEPVIGEVYTLTYTFTCDDGE